MSKPKKADATPITSDQARAARRQLGLTQNQVIKEAGLSAFKMKTFETGSFNPDAPFLQALADFYTSKGVELTPATSTPAPAPAATAPAAPAAPAGQVQRACFYIDGSVPGDLLDTCLERMQNIDARIASILKKPLHTEFFSSGYTDETIQEHQELFGALGEGYLIISLLLGRPIVQAADPAAGKPKTHADLLSQFYAQSPVVTGEEPNPAPEPEPANKAEDEEEVTE